MARIILLDSSPMGLAARAVAFWVDARQRGVPTASPDALDADCILAGMTVTAFDPTDAVTIATSNVSHSARLHGIDARDWFTIT